MNDVKGCVEKASTAEIAFIRDVMSNANPDLLQSGVGFRMTPAGNEIHSAPDAPPEATSTSNLPPASIFDNGDTNGSVELPEEEIIRPLHGAAR